MGSLWGDLLAYIKSDEYQSEQERARRGRREEERPEAIERRDRDRDLRAETVRKRFEFRRMRQLDLDMRAGHIEEIPPQNKDLYRRYVSKELHIELDEWTRKHGYGIFRACPGGIGARGMLRKRFACSGG